MSELRREDYELRQHRDGCALCVFQHKCDLQLKTKKRMFPTWRNECLSDCDNFWVLKSPSPSAITALFEQVLTEHVATAELRDVYRNKLKEVMK